MSQIFDEQLPAGWRTSRLKHVTSLLNRGSAPNYVEVGEVRAISQAANQGGGLDWSRTRYHSFVGSVRNLKGNLRPDDVLINSTGTGTLGRIGFFEGGPDELPCMADSHVTIARFAGDEVYPRFGYYWLSCQPFQDFIYAALIVGATNQIELNRDRLADAPIPLPRWDEQRRIADFLDAETTRIDSLIQARTRQNGLAIELLHRSASELTGRVDLKADPRRTSLRRMIVSAKTGATPEELHPAVSIDDSLIPWYTPAALDGLMQMNDADRFVDLPTYRIAPKFSAGSVVIVGIGESLGKVGYLDHDATGNQQLTALVANRRVVPRFLAWQLWAAQSEVRSWAQYSRIRIINNDTLKSFPMWLPEFSRQMQIVDDLDQRRDYVLQVGKLTAKFVELARERRQALIAAAVTGQLDVTTSRGADLS
ncbi:restriction endonuclease subunit S [Winogradskya humida]|uniref:Type I restriction modification DNA specificity domain-containing protein n=1 Tax=Winogradskya humida TaxID=113566 RepID=A0ABQ3ZQ06_9ACTN|nr:restriction endonuclease subunit S [Actinoplanes humidus]GIE20257.1 hypothetical protein Ahu01nite_033590 [Actinoplanes humidus]